MNQIINAIYEEGVLKPLEPLDIKEHTTVRIIIEPEKDRKRPLGCSKGIYKLVNCKISLQYFLNLLG